jgi:hypothetical protein
VTGDAAGPDWPITVVAHWIDPGYSRFELRLGVGFAAAFLWIAGASAILRGRFEAGLFVIPLIVAAWLGWRWLRRRPAEIDLVLEPTRLRIRDGAAASWVELPRSHPGSLLAAERSLDWQERDLVLIDPAERVGVRPRAGICDVRFLNATDASDAWWRATMPAGTSRDQPPATLPATSLIGAWWPNPNDRWSIRGNLGFRSRWKEADLIGYAAWELRERRKNALIVIATLLFAGAAAIAAAGPLSDAEIVTFVPPFAIGLGAAVRALVR